uniref:Aminoacyl tRNA synthase complex-interacting multifunctional protein 2 n=1 Tax=Strongyloides papillosus TaxID=174720 RepID=A0A0N5B1W4_STREA
MYTLRPNFPLNFTVTPAPVMYTLNSYHGEQSGTSNKDSSSPDETLNYEPKEFSDAEFITKQASLIKDICALKKSFDQFSAKFAQEKPKENATKEAPENKTKEKQGKKDKKENPPTNGKEAPPKSGPKAFEYNTSGKDSAYKQVSDTKASNPYCLSPSLIRFKEQKNVPKKDINVELPTTNSKWFEVMEAVAKKNNIVFDVKVVKNDKATIPKVSCNDVSAEGLVPVWKFLGSVLGIYSYESDVYANTIDKFLNLFASQHDKELSDETWRIIGTHLGTYDTLSCAVEYSLVDIVAYAEFLKSKKEHANNVEIWANRVKTLV